MRLTRFIRDHVEEILADWETFAHTMPVTDSMDRVGVRDHAREMLAVIVRDLDTPQSSGEQSDKAHGKSDAIEEGPPSTAAQEHGAARATSGFTMGQMLSELRALRASVIRLWMKDQPQLEATDLTDMIRFNEAIDQVIAESVAQFTDDVSETKDRFLAILGHDLRNPLGAILMSASYMLDIGDMDEANSNMLTQIVRSTRRMNAMVGDLLDFTRTRLGGDGIPITRAETDATRVLRDIVTEVCTRYPHATLSLDAEGMLLGMWDSARLTQALTNLVSNAVQHGARDTTITVRARGSRDAITIDVHNTGDAIPEANLKEMFKVASRLAPNQDRSDGHLGLGLFIVERIVAAHGGAIEVKSTDTGGTTFTVTLPRLAQPLPAHSALSAA